MLRIPFHLINIVFVNYYDGKGHASLSPVHLLLHIAFLPTPRLIIGFDDSSEYLRLADLSRFPTSYFGIGVVTIRPLDGV